MKTIGKLLAIVAVTAGLVAPAGLARAAVSSAEKVLAREAAPAVVQVNAYKQRLSPTGKVKKLTQVSLGTGFFVSPDGYLLTNRHVVERKDLRYQVDTGKGRELLATVVYRDPDSDIALLRVEGNGFPALRIGADPARPEDRVVAIGNAEGRKRDSVTAGEVLKLGVEVKVREDGKEKRLHGMIQSTARLHAGDSGGPLLNAHGEVVGINAARGSGNRRYEIRSYAVPIREAMEALLQANAGR